MLLSGFSDNGCRKGRIFLTVLDEIALSLALWKQIIFRTPC